MILFVLTALALFGASAPADATTAVLLSREQLVQKSTAVARVTVGRSVTSLSDDGASIVTRTELKVQQLLKGRDLDTVVIEQIGGTYNGRTQRLLGDAALAQGEDAVVFLRPGKGSRWNFTALAMSVYHVDRKGIARRSLGGLHLLQRDARGLSPAANVGDEAEPVESLMTDVVRLAGGKQ